MGIKTFDVELSNVLEGIKSDDCLDIFIRNELSEIGEPIDSLQEVRDFLAGRASGEIVFWEEKEIHEQILYWALEKKKAIEETRKYEESHRTEETNKVETQNTGNNSDNFKEEDKEKEILQRVNEKLALNRYNSEKMYNVLVNLLKEHTELAIFIDGML